MKRQVLVSCLTVTLLMLPRAAIAQAQGAAAKPGQNKSEESKPDEKPASAGEKATKPAEPSPSDVKSAAFADFDNDGQFDLVLGYEVLADELQPRRVKVLVDDVQTTRVADAAAYIELVAKIDDGGIGASLSTAGETLQAQLKLTKGQGLVVTGVTADSPAAKAGLQVDDILLSAGDRPLAKPSDVAEIVNSPVKKPFTVEFTVLRGGERRQVPLTVTEDTAGRQLARVALRHVAEPSYRIGVEVSDAGSTLRGQLKLPTDQGIVIDRVLPDSPAQKAGFQEHDVLVDVGGTPLQKSEDLSAAVKASEGKTLKFSVMRGGQKMEIVVTPEKRSAEAYRLTTTRLAQEGLLKSYSRIVELQGKQPKPLGELVVRSRQREGDTSAQLERVLKQIDELRQAVKTLQSSVTKQQKSSPKPTPSKTDLPLKTDQPKK